MNINDLDEKKLYYVGGIVRDKLLGLESRDVDMVYEGIIEDANEFGTIERNIASTRCEEYPRPGHLPVITKLGCTLQEDAQRRDFTINALYQQGDEILDFVGGLKDLKNKTLRVLHDRSFIDDPTRIIRGLKFAIRFGFELDEHTKKLQDEYLSNVNYDMCYKRVKDELKDTLTSAKAFERFVEQRIYKLITPEPPRIVPQEDLPWVVYAGLLGDLSRLELTREEQKIVKDYGNPQTDLEIYHAFEAAPREAVLLHGLTKDERVARRYLDFLQNIRLEITGDDLKALGIAPGAKYGEIFDRVLAEKFKSPGVNEFELVRNFYQAL
jgi:poly(A) polymerase/tRNA nucleotidyltransferase (CCA-adding enzyme)